MKQMTVKDFLEFGEKMESRLEEPRETFKNLYCDDATDVAKIMERCGDYGANTLRDEELLSIIAGIPTEEAQNMISDLPLQELYDLRTEEMISLVAKESAYKIQCALEFSKRLAKSRASLNLIYDSAETVANYYMEDLRHLKQEKVLLVMLDCKLNFIAEEYLSKCTINAALVSPREVFLEALKRGAVYIMLLHNHPSGDPLPSKFDIDITKRIDLCGKMLGIRLLDHIIIGDRHYISLKSEGVLDSEDYKS